MANQWELRSWRCSGPGCTHTKQESNHWLVIVPSNEQVGQSYIRKHGRASDYVSMAGFECERIDDIQVMPVAVPGLAFYAWDERLLSIAGARPACGLGCATKILAEFFGSLNERGLL